jgi:hypothetical protein
VKNNGAAPIGLKALRRSARSSVFGLLTASMLLLPAGKALALAVGDSVYNPGTGNFETVVQIPSPPNGWVVTAVSSGGTTTFNAVIVTAPAVNSTFVSGGKTYKVLSYTRPRP